MGCRNIGVWMGCVFGFVVVVFVFVIGGLGFVVYFICDEDNI